jgi:hypothetical protein
MAGLPVMGVMVLRLPALVAVVVAVVVAVAATPTMPIIRTMATMVVVMVMMPRRGAMVGLRTLSRSELHAGAGSAPTMGGGVLLWGLGRRNGAHG